MSMISEILQATDILVFIGGFAFLYAKIEKVREQNQDMWVSTNARLDATNARLDATWIKLMEIVERIK